jgi:hypothetical protein
MFYRILDSINWFTAFQKVLYRIPEVHNVLFDRILFDRIQSPPKDIYLNVKK